MSMAMETMKIGYSVKAKPCAACHVPRGSTQWSPRRPAFRSRSRARSDAAEPTIGIGPVINVPGRAVSLHGFRPGVAGPGWRLIDVEFRVQWGKKRFPMKPPL